MQTFDLSPPSWGHGFLSDAVRVRNASLFAPTAPAHRRTAASRAVDGYQVNFRVPADAAKGAAAIQVTAAWLPGPPVKISIE
jgi:hypothetical protein